MVGCEGIDGKASGHSYGRVSGRVTEFILGLFPTRLAVPLWFRLPENQRSLQKHFSANMFFDVEGTPLMWIGPTEGRCFGVPLEIQ